MHGQTGKIHAVLSVMPQPMGEGYACGNLPTTTTWSLLTHGEHKASRRWTWHAPNAIHHSQIDYILVQKRFRSGINRAKTRTFTNVDTGSDHDFVMMTFRVRLKKTNKPKKTRLKFTKTNKEHQTQVYQDQQRTPDSSLPRPTKNTRLKFTKTNKEHQTQV